MTLRWRGMLEHRDCLGMLARRCGIHEARRAGVLSACLHDKLDLQRSIKALETLA